MSPLDQLGVLILLLGLGTIASFTICMLPILPRSKASLERLAVRSRASGTAVDAAPLDPGRR
jgi:hypothetical protein